MSHALPDTVRALLTDLAKAALLGETRPDSAAHWRAEAIARHAEIARHGASPDGLSLNGLWDQAIADVGRDAAVWTDANLSVTLPQQCPLSWDVLLATPLNFERITAALRASTATG